VVRIARSVSNFAVSTGYAPPVRTSDQDRAFRAGVGRANSLCRDRQSPRLAWRHSTSPCRRANATIWCCLSSAFKPHLRPLRYRHLRAATAVDHS
jgi:hypothetical protein